MSGTMQDDLCACPRTSDQRRGSTQTPGSTMRSGQLSLPLAPMLGCFGLPRRGSSSINRHLRSARWEHGLSWFCQSGHSLLPGGHRRGSVVCGRWARAAKGWRNRWNRDRNLILISRSRSTLRRRRIRYRTFFRPRGVVKMEPSQKSTPKSSPAPSRTTEPSIAIAAKGRRVVHLPRSATFTGALVNWNRQKIPQS